MGLVGGGRTSAYRSLMIFIDGGYLREQFKELFHNDEIDFVALSAFLVSATGGLIGGVISPELIRIYYYDAIVGPRDKKYSAQKNYFDTIEENPDYEVKLGRLVRSGKGKLRQKGVDVFLAIDMISKAYMNHYDIALLLAGDDDYVDLVKAVKDGSGKRVYGAYFPEHTSDELMLSFDKQILLTEDILKLFGKSNERTRGR